MEGVVAVIEKPIRASLDSQRSTQPRTARPVAWWAASGAALLALAAYMVVRWIAAGNFVSTPNGPTPMPGWMKTALLWNQIGFLILFVVIMYWFVARPIRSGRSIPLEGVIALGSMSLAFYDGLAGYFQPYFVWNTGSLQRGSWDNFIPGFLAPNMEKFNQPFFTLLCYPAYYVGGMLLGCWLMRAARRRWPQVGTFGLLAASFLGVTVLLSLFEALWLRTGTYSYVATWGPVLFKGHYYQFPLVAGPLDGLLCTSVAALSFFRNDRGETLVERGIDRVNLSGAGKTVVRVLAMAAFVNLAQLVLWSMPNMWFALHSDGWIADASNRSYLTNGLCGAGSDRACPSSAIPTPHRNSAYIDVHGRLVSPP
jgi:hypothetical protein